MKELFKMDTGDYNPDGKVYSRLSVRGIAIKDGKVLLVHSQKYDYYKFPGGGADEGETYEEALIREVREETGYEVIPESIKEFGSVMRRQKDSKDENCIFEQPNLYYFCEVADKAGDQKLDDYEEEEGFHPVWAEPFAISRHNAYVRADDKDSIMIEREAKVLALVDAEMRKQARLAHKRATIEALGNPEFFEMLDYVQKVLEQGKTEYAGAKSDIDYSRFEHTERVLGWAKRLYDNAENKEELRYEDIMIATIFHDVGRFACFELNLPHAEAGVPITKEYLEKKGYDPERTEYITMLVARHSDKWRMEKEPNLDKGLLLLMEADLLDDMGALGIVMDCMITEARNPNAHFTDCLDHITRFTLREQAAANPMVTPAGRKIWDEKTKLVNQFVSALKADVEL
ncbi:MAG: NUDIX domain-containing protein [Lachnospiraceae bacterium]|nr:NUDIX domain-containing protein [Lachnospiraceae bacterium]